VSGVSVWIRVFEDVGCETFFLLTKLGRFGRITCYKEDTNNILLSYPLNILGTCKWVYTVLH